jgi:hypothetical protein
MYIYTNNFPREGAIRGQNFEGNKSLEEELKARGIIVEIKEEESKQETKEEVKMPEKNKKQKA